MAARYQGYRYPIEVIGHAVWLYHRFALSLRDVEELMLGHCQLEQSEGDFRRFASAIHQVACDI